MLINITHPLRRRQQVRFFFHDIEHLGDFYKKMKKADVSTSGLAYEIYAEFFLRRYEEILPIFIDHLVVAPECNPGYDFHFEDSYGEQGIIECKWKSNLQYRFSIMDLASFVAEKHDRQLNKQRTVLFTNIVSERPFTETAHPKLIKWLTLIDGKVQQDFIKNDRNFWPLLAASMVYSCE